MTTILAGANWTMWPELTSSNISSESDSDAVRDHARIAYALTTSTSYTREIDETMSGWLGVIVKPATSFFTSAINGYFLEAIDADGNTLFGIRRGDSGGDGNHTTEVDAPFLSNSILVADSGEPLFEVSIRFTIAENGEFAAFSDGTQVGSFNGDTRGSAGGVVGFRISKNSTSSPSERNTLISEFLLSTQNTIGFKVVDTELSVASLSQWDGTPSNITPVGYASTEDSLSTGDADQLVTFSRPDIPALGDDDLVASVHFETSQLADSGAPAPEADLLVYDGSEHGAERIQPGTSFSEFRVKWDQDPRTNEPWTEAGVNEIEVGVASRTA